MLHADRADLQTSINVDRVDQGRYRLPPPRPVGSGGKIFTMALAAPGVLSYHDSKPPFAKLVPAEVLSDPEWLASFVGVPIVDDDQGAHAIGVNPSTIARESIGRMIRAWWDEQQQVVLGEGVIDVDRGLRAIAAGTTGVSPAYPSRWFDEVGETDGQRYTRIEVQRLPTENVAITLKPRGGTTHLQPDAIGGRKMNPWLVSLLAYIAANPPPKLSADAAGAVAADPAGWAFGQLMERDARMSSDFAALKASHDALTEKMKGMIPKPADETDEEKAKKDEDAKAADALKVQATADALFLADAYQVPAEDRTKGLAHLQRAICTAAKVPGAETLHADAVRGTLIGLRLVAGKTGDAWDRFKPLNADAAKPTNPMHGVQ